MSWSIQNWRIQWRIALIQNWKEHIEYFEKLYLKYLHKEPEISDNAKRIIGSIKKIIQNLKGEIDLLRTSGFKKDIKPIIYP